MIICVCKGISDNHIREAAAEGVVSLKQLNQALGVASQCGKCAHYAREVLEEHLSSSSVIDSSSFSVGYFSPKAATA